VKQEAALAGQGEEIIVGLDIGLRHLAMATLDPDGRARVIPNAEGHARTPTAVHFYQADGVVVGEEALKVATLEPDTTCLDVITLLGEQDGGRTFFERAWSPQELVALVLRKLRVDASELRGQEVTEACLSVPGFFDSAQRAALVAATEIAGWNVRAVVPQSTATLLGVGLGALPDPARALLVDVRDRGVEVTLLRREGDELLTLASELGPESGAYAVRAALEQLLIEAWRRELGEDPTTEPAWLSELQLSAAHALEGLGRSPTLMARIGAGDRRRGVRLEREPVIKAAWEPITAIARLALNACRRDGGRPPDAVLVTGDGAGIPGLRRALQFGLKVDPLRDDAWADASTRGVALLAAMRLQPDHPGLTPARPRPPRAPEAPRSSVTPPPPAAARPRVPPASGGAATDSGEARPRSPGKAVIGLADGGHLRPVKVREVTTRSLGMIVLDHDRTERVVEIVPDATPLPARFRGRFVYAFDNMTSVRVEVTEGRGTHRDQVRVIGTVELTGLPPRPRGTPIEVVYLYNDTQILQVEVTDLNTGKMKKVDIAFRGALSRPEVDAARSRTSSVHVG
jgi:molecular chaperone DnaK